MEPFSDGLITLIRAVVPPIIFATVTVGIAKMGDMWRMHMVRLALRQRAPTDTTVTEVSMRYGFWQLGRFAVEYKAVFGESPSATLARIE